MNQFLIIGGSDHSTASPEKMQKRLAAFNDWVQATEFTKECPLLGEFRLELPQLKPMA